MKKFINVITDFGEDYQFDFEDHKWDFLKEVVVVYHEGENGGRCHDLILAKEHFVAIEVVKLLSDGPDEDLLPFPEICEDMEEVERYHELYAMTKKDLVEMIVLSERYAKRKESEEV